MDSIYVCSNKRCPEKGREFQAMSPSEARQAFGSGIACGKCGEPASLRRMVTKPNAKGV
jgi:bacterioferritin-associated ferredoxin